jgi:hypothetical protein
MGIVVGQNQQLVKAVVHHCVEQVVILLVKAVLILPLVDDEVVVVDVLLQEQRYVWQMDLKKILKKYSTEINS